MLDAEGYPNTFIRYGNYKIEFSRASLKMGLGGTIRKHINNGDIVNCLIFEEGMISRTNKKKKQIKKR